MAKKTKVDIKKLVDGLNEVNVQIRAAHLNYVNGNNLFYRSSAALKGGKSWVAPYTKPQIVNHDTSLDPIGRITSYKVIEDSEDLIESEPKDYVLLTVNITDKDAMYKVLSGIYNTCSVGSSALRVLCSECGQDLTEDGLCEHEKGTLNDKGKTIYWIIDDIRYKENSFVNIPADSFSRIESIDFGDGYIAYIDYLGNRESLLAELNDMEDSMIKKKRLTKDERQNLPESKFCGPSRSFPAHDKEHLQASLTSLKSEDCKLEDSLKNKILASLYRKGARFNIEQTDEERIALDENTFRMDDTFTEDEIKAIATMFDAAPDSDLPKDPVDPVTPVVPVVDPIVPDVKVEPTDAEVIAGLKKELEDEKTKVAELTKTVTSLESNLADSKVTISANDDEINTLLDKCAIIEKKYKVSLIDHVVTMKIGKTGDAEIIKDLRDKLNTRKIDSLVDTINDLSVEVSDSTNVTTKVEDPTALTNDKTLGTTEIKDSQEDEISVKDPKFKIFYTKKNK